MKFANDKPFVLIAGPCQIEDRDSAMYHALQIKLICDSLDIDFVFKSSYDKANRTSISGKRGVGIDEGLRILEEVKMEFDVPVITDVHHPEQCKPVAQVVDILQIPAFLCRQTDLLVAAGETGKQVMVKKGQFLAPWDMIEVAKKIESTGNSNIILCERGTSFGYNALVSDMGGLPILKKTGYPVVFDATHSAQRPGINGGSSGGDRDLVPVLARAAVAVGVAGVFMEVHKDPENAPSDSATMLHLSDLPALLALLKRIDEVIK